MVDLYQPKLRVEQGEDGLFVVHAATPTPNTCHVAQEPHQDTTSGEARIPENQSYVLPITQTDGPCRPEITTVRHQFTPSPNPGQRMVTVTTTLDGKEVGSGSIRLPEFGESGSEPKGDVPRRRSAGEPILSASDWHAFVDLQPKGEPRLYVEGLLTLAHPGYKLSLIAPPNNRDQERVTLQLEVERREGPWIQIPVRRSVRYEETGLADPENIDTVAIKLPASEKPMTINVQHVH